MNQKTLVNAIQVLAIKLAPYSKRKRSGQEATPNLALDNQLSEYRKHLVAAEQKTQEDFDKTVLSLSGGALGISFIFLKDVIGPNFIHEPLLLSGAWIAWGASTLSVLASYYLSHLALRTAIRQVDEKTIYSQKPGGGFRTATALLNAMGAILFFVGVCLIVLFAHVNLKAKGIANVPTQNTSISSPTTSPSNSR